MMNHPTYPYLIWIQAIASDTHIDAYTTGYVSPALTPLVVTRDTQDSWVGFDVEDRNNRRRESHYMKTHFQVVVEEEEHETHTREDMLTALNNAIRQQIGKSA